MQLAIIFIVATLVFFMLRILLSRSKLSIRQFGTICLLALIGLSLIYLGISGRLHWLFVLLGSALPFLTTMLTWAIRLFRTATWLGVLQSLFRSSHSVGAKANPSQGQASVINTEYLKMRLDHDSGNLEGRVLKGQYAGQHLSELTVNNLRSLLTESNTDQDTVNLLVAYLERYYPDWHQHADNTQATTNANSAMSAAEALDILGLTAGASRTDIIQAHRKLMQKVHPDHGGSTYLASRINEAKAVLTKAKG